MHSSLGIGKPQTNQVKGSKLLNNKALGNNIYFMGIGGTGMGAMAGLLKSCGFRVSGSDSAVYSPMKEKLKDWQIEYKTPYQAQNLSKNIDLVIVGNVIRKDNPEAVVMRELNLKHDSFPSAINKFFLQNATSLVACGTHGKTTCTALMAHCLKEAGHDPGFLVGGIPLNFNESFRASQSKSYPFVIEGDEYDTAYFDKRPKFIHYNPKFLLVTSIEFDHADIYDSLDSIIKAFSSLFASMKEDSVIIANNKDDNIKKCLTLSRTKAKVIFYNHNEYYNATNTTLSQIGLSFQVANHNQEKLTINIPLFGHHNLDNALGCYALLREYGLNHKEIEQAFLSFKGVKRRLEEKFNSNEFIVVDDFAHHPTAVRETIKAAKQRYPEHEICAIFEPRSATSCLKIFEQEYISSFLKSELVIFAPVGRKLDPEKSIDTCFMAKSLTKAGIKAKATMNTNELMSALTTQMGPKTVFLFMSNGDFGGVLNQFLKNIS